MVATVIWSVGRSMLLIMDEPGTSGKSTSSTAKPVAWFVPDFARIDQDRRGRCRTCSRLPGTTDQYLLAKARITV